ncbi:MAG: hypothetical protein ABFQ62_03930 [Patescibacteria group bacterium]
MTEIPVFDLNKIGSWLQNDAIVQLIFAQLQQENKYSRLIGISWEQFLLAYVSFKQVIAEVNSGFELAFIHHLEQETRQILTLEDSEEGG